MPDPRSSTFWRDETDRLRAILTDLLMRVYLRGGDEALQTLDNGLDALVDFEQFSTAATQWVQQNAGRLAQLINGTSQKIVVQTFDEWLRSGEPLSALQRQLEPMAGRHRARQIAATEVTRAFAEGNMQMWDTTGFVSGKVWQTARDERVCPICGPLHDQVVELNGGFGLDPETVAGSSAMRGLVGSDADRRLRRAQTLLRNNGSRYDNPPAHVNCRCWLKPTVSEESANEQQLRRLGLLSAFYDLVERGDIVYLEAKRERV